MNLPKHMPALDGLRGVAILLVLLLHVSRAWTTPWSDAIAGAAEHGVILFFVVSAFTLTVRAVHDRNGLRSYALRRVARVGPGYWIAGLVYTLAFGVGPRMWASDGIAPADIAIAAIFGSAWQGGAALAVVPGGWSVSCEVAFYIALPFIIRIVGGKIWRAAALLCLAFAVAQLRARQAILADTYDFAFFVNPVQQAPVFLMGVTAALAAMRVRLPRLPGAPVAVLALATIIVPLLKIPGWYLQHHFAFAALAAVTVALAAANARGLLASRVMRRIGEVSYSMYLVHFAFTAAGFRLAGWLVPTSAGTAMLLQFIIVAAASFAVAQVTYRFIEQPPIRWAAKRFLASPRLRAPATASPYEQRVV